MNAGFASLSVLKSHLLAVSMRANLDYDAVITAMGLGMAAAIETFCNRKLARVENDVALFPADRVSFVLPRFPVEAVSAAELKQTDAAGFEPLSLANLSTSLESGVLYTNNGADVGPYSAQVRITYTGGFWWDDTEDSIGEMPDGATALLEDIRQAWLLQCQAVWGQRDKIGQNIADKPGAESPLQKIELLAGVKEMLRPHIRMSLI